MSSWSCGYRQTQCYVYFYATVQLYWFKFILQLIWKIVVLREVLEDNRDFKEEGKNQKEENQKHNKDMRNESKKQN